MKKEKNREGEEDSRKRKKRVERKNSLGDEEAHARLHTHEWGLLPPLKCEKKKRKKKEGIYIRNFGIFRS